MKHKEIAAMLLYCHFIIFEDTDKPSTIKRLKDAIGDDEAVDRVSKKFENKIMNYLAKNTQWRGRKNMAIITSVIIEPNNSAALMNLLE